MVVVGGAWPLLVTLTPAADRPWISGTSDNSIWSLIFGYNGLGRVAGQTGGPGGAGGRRRRRRLRRQPVRRRHRPVPAARSRRSAIRPGGCSGSPWSPGSRSSSLTRLRRRDPRTGWLIVVGGAFLTTAVVFSFASGIFHPYYVSFLAPFAAALVGAGAGLMLPRSLGGAADGRAVRVIAPLAIAAGAITELVVLGELGGAMPWAKPVVIGIAGACAIAARDRGRRPVSRGRGRGGAGGAARGARRRGRSQTLGHATSSTFPAGGPASASIGGPGGGGGPAGSAAASGGVRLAGAPVARWRRRGPPGGSPAGGRRPAFRAAACGRAAGGFAGGRGRFRRRQRRR